MDSFTISKYVKHSLNPEELAAVAATLAQATTEQQRLDEELTAVKSQFKGRIDEAKGKGSAAAHTYDCGFEYRTLACPAVIVGDIITIRHPETMDVLETRKASDKEKQISLELDSE